MAQCIKCKTTIPNGTQYCENCYTLVKDKADESYLDSLLSSITPSESTKDIYRKHKIPGQEQGELKLQDNHGQGSKFEDMIGKPIPSDYNIFSSSDEESDMDYLATLFNYEEGKQPQLDLSLQNEVNHKENKNEVDESLAEDSFDYNEILNLKEESLPNVEVTKIIEDESCEEDLENDVLGTEQTSVDDNGHDNAMDELLSELLPLADMLEEDNLKKDIKQESNNKEEEEPAMKNEYDFSQNDQDLLDLINEINNSQELPPEEQTYENESNNNIDKKEEKKTSSLDIGDVFADALGAVSSLEDNSIDDDLLKMIPDIEERSSINTANGNEPNKKQKKEQKKEQKKDQKEKQSIEKKKRLGFWKRIFGNIREELTEEELEARKNKIIQEGEQKEEQEKLKQEAKKAKKAQAKEEKAEKEKQAKELAAKKKAENAAKAKAKKEEKEKRSREIQELIDEIDENEGKINKVGASIIFVFFAATAIVIVIGTNLYSYAVNIKNATMSFERQLYNEAYQNVYGIDIKDEDIEIYDKIMTVMYVNKQLNSYANYLNMKKYPEALDSLLKGLDRYEKYYMLATLHGIEDDLNYVKKHIVDELNQTFYLSEEEASDLLAYQDQIEYSSEVYRLAKNHKEAETDTKSEDSKQE